VGLHELCYMIFMRLSMEQFLTKIGVEATLRPYETIPFDYFNPDKGIDVLAEVSLSGDGTAINVEIQQITHGANDKMDFRQIMQMELDREPTGIFMAKILRYDGQSLTAKKNWFENGCRFIKQAMALIKKGTLPDFEAIFKATLEDNDTGVGGGGAGGGRSFKNDKPPPKPGQAGRF
jgi:hypothetical protein